MQALERRSYAPRMISLTLRGLKLDGFDNFLLNEGFPFMRPLNDILISGKRSRLRWRTAL